MLFKYQGQISAALVLGGMDINGPALYSIYPHGSVDKLYVTAPLRHIHCASCRFGVAFCNHTPSDLSILLVFLNICNHQRPYVTMGSGSLAAMGVFEDGFKPDMTREEGCELVRQAIRAGIFNDLGSGSNVDICVITDGDVEYIRPFETANEKGVRQGDYTYKRGTTEVTSTSVVQIVSETVEVVATGGGAAGTMDQAAD